MAVTPAEITEIARKRFSKRSDKSKLAVSRYVNSLNLNLSKQAVEGIAQKVTKHYARQGVVESYTREEAEKKVKKEFKLDCEILNTKDTTRTLRIFPRLMKNFIKNHSPLQYVDFHSDATTHKEIEDGRVDSQGELLEYHNLCIDYAEILGDRYLKKAPLPRIPTLRPYGSIARPYVGQYHMPVWTAPADE